jgi:hypothetical protein
MEGERNGRGERERNLTCVCGETPEQTIFVYIPNCDGCAWAFSPLP